MRYCKARSSRHGSGTVHKNGNTPDTAVPDSLESEMDRHLIEAGFGPRMRKLVLDTAELWPHKFERAFRRAPMRELLSYLAKLEGHGARLHPPTEVVGTLVSALFGLRSFSGLLGTDLTLHHSCRDASRTSGEKTRIAACRKSLLANLVCDFESRGVEFSPYAGNWSYPALTSSASGLASVYNHLNLLRYNSCIDEVLNPVK